jgi:DNA-binding NtrC family response regulator
VLPPTAFVFDRQRIVVADEELPVVEFIIETLRRDGHCVSRASDPLYATQDVALRNCHLFISSTQVAGQARPDLLDELRDHLPALAILYLAGPKPAPDVEAQLPVDVQILREPFTAEELRAAVRPLLPQLGRGSILALSADRSGPERFSGGHNSRTGHHPVPISEIAS